MRLLKEAKYSIKAPYCIRENLKDTLPNLLFGNFYKLTKINPSDKYGFIKIVELIPRQNGLLNG